MCDSPKAAHFDAFFGGKLLDPFNSLGMKYRWLAARSVEIHVTENMLDSQIENRIDQHLAEISSKFPVMIKRKI